MSSFVRISDIPPDELNLLPTFGLRQQIRKDRNRISSPNSRINEGMADGSPPGRAQHAESSAVDVSPAAGERFVTEWQLQNEQPPSSGLPFGREDIHNDEDRGGDEFDDENLDEVEDEDAGEEDERWFIDENNDANGDFDTLCVVIVEED